MQVKPRFHEFKILDSIDLLTDDFGTTFRLLTYEGKFMDIEDYDIVSDGRVFTSKQRKVEKYEKDTIVCSKNLVRCSSGATGYDTRILWKPGHKIMKDKMIGKFKITEIKDEYGHSYCKDGIVTELIVNEKL